MTICPFDEGEIAQEIPQREVPIFVEYWIG